MANVTCPHCGKLMHRTAMTETLRDGTRIVIYTCPDRWRCGTILRLPE